MSEIGFSYSQYHFIPKICPPDGWPWSNGPLYVFFVKHSCVSTNHANSILQVYNPTLLYYVLFTSSFACFIRTREGIKKIPVKEKSIDSQFFRKIWVENLLILDFRNHTSIEMEGLQSCSYKELRKRINAITTVATQISLRHNPDPYLPLNLQFVYYKIAKRSI